VTRARTTAEARREGGRPAAERPVRVRRIGILGGTFDPIHNGHLGLAASALSELEIDEIVFIPAGSPPHKQGRPITAAADRLAMVALAVGGLPDMSVDPVEIERPGLSYTVDTVTSLIVAADADGRPIAPTVIMSADAFADLPTWHEPDRLIRLARIAVAPRRGHRPPDPSPVIARLPGLAGRVDIFDGPDLDISASDIRTRVAAGLPIGDIVPEPVVAYIAAHHLYRDPQRRKDRT
jgi:nicotinate-nucleotide adenylyltransferase